VNYHQFNVVASGGYQFIVPSLVNSFVPSFPKEKPQKIPPSPDLTSPRQKEKKRVFSLHVA
jgi:hypothetical protein